MDAFVALGGSRDRSGRISTTILTRIVAEFKLTLDIEALVEMADEDKSGWGAAVPCVCSCVSAARDSRFTACRTTALWTLKSSKPCSQHQALTSCHGSSLERESERETESECQAF